MVSFLVAFRISLLKGVILIFCISLLSFSLVAYQLFRGNRVSIARCQAFSVFFVFVISLSALFIMVPTVDPVAGDYDSILAGKDLYKLQCSTCHSPDIGVGPRLSGIYSRRAGEYPGYAYSSEMRRSGVSWTRGEVVKFLTGSSGLLEASNMVIQPLSEEQASDVAAYLESL